MSLGEQWRQGRPPVLGVHLDSAACSRQSIETIRAVAQHAEHEAQIGGYVAQEAATPVLDAGRAAVRHVTGMPEAQVHFTTGAADALRTLLQAWPADTGRVIACLPGEFGPNLMIMNHFGFTPVWLPADGDGRADLDGIEAFLRREKVDLVHLTAVGSHRGTVQPAAEVVACARAAGVPVVVDAAQALGHIDCTYGADAMYAPSRKWLAGPRGVGVLAVNPSLAHLVPQWAGHIEAHVAGWVGLSVALGQHLAAGAAEVQGALVERGRSARKILGEIEDWRVVESVDEPSAITTLEPADDVDVVAVRARLIAEHAIVTTAAETVRAPFEMTRPVLRISPHVDGTDDELEQLRAVLEAV
ncbi:ergothioneine biosynthesis PLP-dependent enzyme EgtE [Mycobacteroides salmoniphilum]|uniref:ergothioneine biosynthesis PLP-dependent enzyme EgtE n=1 Tax=Mycobacteroides salmoniphilum TaxID=404941 RepID=UPI0009946AF7|nr:ergothioneine biosynthesis PLP-dependent enzyme EgtE [Mycobacteroides salmoniphilum]